MPDIVAKEEDLYSIGCVINKYITLPYDFPPSLYTRSSWLFPERSIEKLTPYDAKPNQANSYGLHSKNLYTEKMFSDNPLEYYSLLAALPMPVRRLLQI